MKKPTLRNRNVFLLNFNLYSKKVAKSEIARILGLLNVPESKYYKKKIFISFKQVWRILSPERIYKDPELLVPLIIYFYLRSRKISVDCLYLIENSRITENNFYAFVFQILEYIISSKEEPGARLAIEMLELEREKEKFRIFNEFLEFFSACPTCNQTHDKNYLMECYFNSNKRFKRKAFKIMKCPELRCKPYDKESKKLYGIPCSNCYDKIFYN